MKVPAFLFTVSLAGLAAAATLPGWSDLVMLAGPSALASIVLMLRARPRRAKPGRGADPKWIVVDGSNVMYWKGETPRIDPVREVVRHLSRLGYTPGVMFDANAGYLLSGKYRHDSDLGMDLDLPQKRVMVVPKGTPADHYILTAARDLGARIVTNDRFRDWAKDHPEINEPGRLVRGEYREGKLWLELESNESSTPSPTTVA